MRKPEQYVRRVGRTLVWLFQRAGLWLKWRPAAPANRVPRALHFESLEPRLLLSADLLPVGIHSAALNDAQYSSGDHPTVTVLVRNQGDTAPDQPVTVNLYASPFAGGEETRVGGALLDVSALLPGAEASAVPIALDFANLSLAHLALAGDYSLRAEIDPDNRIAEADEANNSLALTPAFSLTGATGGPAALAADLPASGGAETPAVTSKYFVLPSNGANFIDFDLSLGSLSLQGQEIVFVGSTRSDAAFVHPGIGFDFTGSVGGVDKLYLEGNLNDYAIATSGTSFLLLSRGSGASLETVKVAKDSRGAAISDVLVFADGTVNTYDLYEAVANQTARPTPSGETSLNPAAPAAPGSVLDASIKAFSIGATGETFAMARPGMAMTVVGGIGVDTIYVPDGGNVDATGLVGNADWIYFRGNWADYSKTVVSSIVTFSRVVGGVTETVKVVGGTGNSNDHLVFADGAVFSNNARLALNANPGVAIDAIAGYDPGTTTPGVGAAAPASVLRAALGYVLPAGTDTSLDASPLAANDAPEQTVSPQPASGAAEASPASAQVVDFASRYSGFEFAAAEWDWLGDWLSEAKDKKPDLEALRIQTSSQPRLAPELSVLA